MSVEKVFDFIFGLFRKDLKVILPSTLSLVPTALLSLIILQGFTSVFSSIMSMNAAQVLNSLLFYIPLAFIIFLFSILIHFFLLAVYSDIVKQAIKGKVNLINSFETGKKEFWKIFSTYFLAFIFLIGINVIILPLLFLGPLGIILFLILLFLINFLVYLFLFEIPPLIVFEGKSGIDAMKRSFEIGKSKFWNLLFIIFFFGLIYFSVNSALSSVPFIGILLLSISSLFLNSFYLMLPAAFYFFVFKQKA